MTPSGSAFGAGRRAACYGSTTSMTTVPALETWLKGFIGEHGGVAGSVHEREGELLRLRAAVNLPPPVVKVTETIPKGKGMAGLAWERNRSVAVCNLQSDQSGDVRPGARAVAAQAALAIPVRGDDGDVRAVVGIAFMGERDFSEAELGRFEALAASVPASS
jgi:L-methionine (R)-S-oxide reductase